jgi:hypothetical protein
MCLNHGSCNQQDAPENEAIFGANRKQSKFSMDITHYNIVEPLIMILGSDSEQKSLLLQLVQQVGTHFYAKYNIPYACSCSNTIHTTQFEVSFKRKKDATFKHDRTKGNLDTQQGGQLREEMPHKDVLNNCHTTGNSKPVYTAEQRRLMCLVVREVKKMEATENKKPAQPQHEQPSQNCFTHNFQSPFAAALASKTRVVHTAQNVVMEHSAELSQRQSDYRYDSCREENNQNCNDSNLLHENSKSMFKLRLEKLGNRQRNFEDQQNCTESSLQHRVQNGVGLHSPPSPLQPFHFFKKDRGRPSLEKNEFGQADAQACGLQVFPTPRSKKKPAKGKGHRASIQNGGQIGSSCDMRSKVQRRSEYAKSVSARNRSEWGVEVTAGAINHSSPHRSSENLLIGQDGIPNSLLHSMIPTSPLKLYHRWDQPDTFHVHPPMTSPGWNSRREEIDRAMLKKKQAKDYHEKVQKLLFCNTKKKRRGGGDVLYFCRCYELHGCRSVPECLFP